MTTAHAVWRFSRSAEWAFEAFLFFCFLFVGVVYFSAFAYDLDRYLFTEGYLQLALNSHDHQVYVSTMEEIRAFGVEYGLNNDFGIASIYGALAAVFPGLVNDGFTLLPFLFNSVVLLATYMLWLGICDSFGFGFSARILFFANTSLLYFMQLINKDMLTIFAFLFVIRAAQQRRLWLILCAVPLLFLVRQQLAVFAILFLYFMRHPLPLRRIWVAYIVTSLAAGLLSVFASVIGEDSMGDGFSAFLTQVNTQYYIGYLVFNPIRVLQYIIDAYASFWFFTDTGGVDMAKVLRLPQLVVIAFLVKPIWRLVANFKAWLQTPAKPLALTIVAYLLAWLMNPTVNARYVMLITPVLVLSAFYVKASSCRNISTPMRSSDER